MFRRIRLGVIAILLVAPASQAHAGSYQVDTCADRDDFGVRFSHSIGRQRDMSGWIEDGNLVGAGMSGACEQGPIHIYASASARLHAGDSFGATWTAPPTTHLIGVHLSMYAVLGNRQDAGEGTSHLRIGTERQTLFEKDSFGDTGTSITPVNGTVLDASTLQIAFSCRDDCHSSRGDWITGELPQATFTVRDDVAPTGAVSGSAVGATLWNERVPFDLVGRDAGSGVAAVVVEVDGRDVRRLAIGGGACASTVREGQPVYHAAQPCAPSADGTYSIDTTTLPQGDHTVRILLEDASGNRTAVFGPVTRRIDATNTQIGPGSDPAKRGALNGDKAADDARMTTHWGVRGRRTRLTSDYGHRHVISGRLTTAQGEPISGATLDLQTRTTAVNARTLPKRGPQTTSDGNFAIVLPRNVSSRDVTLRYRSHVADTIPVATNALRLRVRAGVRLTVSPRTVVRGQTVRFRGRLLGGPIPRGGKQLVMTARGASGGWLRFDVVRTDRRGRFTLTYRFKQPGAARYRFRALSLAEAAYPYLAGGSNVAVVRKR